MTRKRFTPSNDPRSTERPRDLLPIETSWLQIAKRPISVRKDRMDQEISIGEAVVQKQAENALKGSTHAQGQFLNSVQKAERIAARKVEADVKEGYEIQHHINTRFKHEVAAGNDPNLFTPHPDDFILTEGVGYEIKGPIDAVELELILNNCARRDVLFLQAFLEERLATREQWQIAGDDVKKQPGIGANVIALWMDESSPQRFQLTKTDIMEMRRRTRQMTERELLKAVRLA